MKKFSFLLILFQFLVSLSFGQSQVISVHPLVGDTIDQEEKSIFHLFPEIPDSSFSYAFIATQDSTHYLLTTELLSKDAATKTITSHEKEALAQRITDYDNYYQSQLIKEKQGTNQPIDLNTNNAELSKSMESDFKQQQWQQKYDQRIKDLNQGFFSPPPVFEMEIGSKKKKK